MTDLEVINTIEQNVGRLARLTFTNKDDEQVTGTITGLFNGNMNETGRTRRYEFEKVDSPEEGMYYLFIDEIKEITFIERSPALREINLTPNFAALRQQFMGEFESNLFDSDRADAKHWELLRGVLVPLNITIQSVDTVAALVEFRTQLGDIVGRLVQLHNDTAAEEEAMDSGNYDPDEDEEDDDEDSDEPEEEDLVTFDGKHFYHVGSYSGFDVKLNRNAVFVVGEGEDRDKAIRAYMDKTRFWPDAWSISDHGNAHRIDLSKSV